MQIKHLQKIPHNSISSQNKFQESYKKKEKLDLYDKLRSEGCRQKTTLQAIKISRSTYYVWKKKYKQNGLEGLENQSRCPNKVRKPTWNSDTEQLVLNTRKKYKLWGKYKIAAIIKREQKINLSVSMVGRIISKHIKLGNIKPVEFYFGKLTPKKHRVFNNHAKRWKYGMKAKMPGELIQLDHMTVKLISGFTVRHFTAICPITKFAIKQAYTSATSNIAKEFLKQIKQQFPFEVKSLQVDGGSEFMGAFEQGCEREKIPLFVLPPRRPKYNSNVERGHCTAKYEFYWQYDGPNGLSNIRVKLKEYTDFYNKYRPHQRLNYLTPMEYCNHWRSKKSHMY